MNNNRKIAHLADIHVRFGSRHEEYRIVFKRTVEDLEKLKPRRIVIAGDLFHQKINLSPAAIELMTEFLRDLSKIAPVDIIVGNHDMNEQDLNQGNTIKPIIDLIDNGFIITSHDKKNPTIEGRNSIYFYHDSGFYQIDDELIYGVYSLWDNEIIVLDDKKPNKKYIGLYHGPVFGSMSDNGFVLKGDELIRTSTFNNFDIVMLGDIHEHQTFELDGEHRIAYSGSLIQQDISEGLEKGYLLWDIDKCDFDFRYIPNDYGFSKITINKGEIWQERIEDLKLSFNPKKTKVFIEIVDDAENENVELKSQIKKFVKQRWGCEFVSVEFQKILKTKVLGIDADQFDLSNSEQWEKLLIAYLIENDYKDNDSVIELSREVEKEMDYKKPLYSNSEWDLVSMTVSNLFMLPVTPTFFPWDELKGIVGIFGQNFSGKSNVIKALIWGLYQQVLGGNVGDNHKVVNMYTGKKTAYTEIIINIMGQMYKIYRSIELSHKKDGTTSAKYQVDYSYLIEENGEEIWVQEKSDRAVKEKPEIKKMIVDAIGTFDNFTKISLQTQGGKDDYLSMAQQDKNTVIREYNGLTPCDVRYEIVNKKFNQVKNLQKNLGDPTELEKQIEEVKNLILDLTQKSTDAQKEKDECLLEIEVHNQEILNLTKQLHKLENITETNEIKIKNNIEISKKIIDKNAVELEIKEKWISTNFLKEIPKELESINISDVENKIDIERTKFQNNKDQFLKIKTWLDSNQKQESLPVEEVESQLEKAKEKLLIFKNDLIISRGQKCPTCGSVTKEADENKEKDCIEKINKAELFIVEKQSFIKQQKEIEKNNQTIIQNELKLEALKNALESNKNVIDQNKIIQEQFKNITSDVLHNKQIKTTTEEIAMLKKSIELNSKIIETSENNLKVLIENSEKLKENDLTNNKILSLQESLKGYKQSIVASDRTINELTAKIKVQENNIENYQDKINQIRESVKIFNKYSIYLQAVSRDGIPAQILRKRMPTINYKINSILQNVVNFKIELAIKPNGDIVDYYYFNDDKSDALPLNLASGSQKFIGSVAIRDALHYISCIVKPSFCIIDEGFGTLDDEKVTDILNVFPYLKSKYKLVIIITHKSVIKDGVDHIITVSKTQHGLPIETIQNNPNAGITQISFK